MKWSRNFTESMIQAESRNQMADQVAKEAAQGPLTLAIKTSLQSAKEIPEKQTLTREEGLEYLTNIHRLTHLGEKKMIKLVGKSPYHIPQLQKIVEELVKNCQACALTNTVPKKTPKILKN